MTKMLSLTPVDIINSGIPVDHIEHVLTAYDTYVSIGDSISALEAERHYFDDYNDSIADDEDKKTVIQQAYSSVHHMAVLDGITLGGAFQVATSKLLMIGQSVEDAFTNSYVALFIYLYKKEEAGLTKSTE